jgi:hypothetical protein
MSHKKINKKAMILYYPIILGFVVGLAVFYAYSLTSEPKGQTNYVGEIAINYMKADKMARPILSYIESATKQASYQSIYDLAQKGGFHSEPSCGSLQGFSLWSTESTDCYPNIKQNLTSFLKEYLNNYLIIDEDTSNFKDNYDFLLEQQNNQLRIIATATLPIKIPITIQDNKETDQKQIGNYSLTPSVEQVIDYNLSDYEAIKKQTIDITSTCEKELDIKNCVEKKVEAINTLHEVNPEEYALKWNVGYSNPVEKLFYGFIENYESCLNSKDIGCKCGFNLDYENTNLNGEYVITITHDGSSTQFELTKPQIYNLIYKIKNHLPAVIDRDLRELMQQFTDFQYIVTYSNGNYKSTQLVYPLKIQEFDLTQETRLYKKSKEKVVFVSKDSPEYQNLPDCSVPNVFKFSVVNEGKKFYVYNQKNQKSEFMPIETRFAVYIKDLPPPPIAGLKIQNEQRAEGSVLLTWKKSQALDIMKYSIYYSQGDFIRRPIEDHNILNSFFEVASKQINTNVKYTYERISPTVLYDQTNKIWGHLVFKDGQKIEKFEPGQLYYATETQEYFYILDGLVDTKPYYFGITAIDKAGNEIDNIDPEQKLNLNNNYAKATPQDNLAPNKITNLAKQDYSPYYYRFTFNLPTTNEDGTPLKEDKLYLYDYLVESSSCAFDDIKFKIADSQTRSNYYTPGQKTGEIYLMNLKRNFDYCLTFIMNDEVKNPNLVSSNLKDIIVTYNLHTLS